MNLPLTKSTVDKLLKLKDPVVNGELLAAFYQQIYGTSLVILDEVNQMAQKFAKQFPQNKIAAIKALREWSQTCNPSLLDGYDVSYPPTYSSTPQRPVLGLAQSKNLIEKYWNI